MTDETRQSPAETVSHVSRKQSDETIRNMIAREIWRYQECEEAYGSFDDCADETKQPDIGMRALIKQTAIDQAELIRAVVLASPVVKAAIARLITDDDMYEIGVRDGYEDAIQNLDLATGGDGEFKGSTIPGATVDVPAMQARIIERFRTIPSPPSETVSHECDRIESDIWPAIAANVREQVNDGDGFWKPCSGCYEMEDGQNVHGYPHSKVFGCVLGSGCGECGGIGAIWDTTDYAAMGEELSREQLTNSQRSEGK